MISNVVKCNIPGSRFALRWLQQIKNKVVNFIVVASLFVMTRNQTNIGTLYGVGLSKFNAKVNGYLKSSLLFKQGFKKNRKERAPHSQHLTCFIITRNNYSLTLPFRIYH